MAVHRVLVRNGMVDAQAQQHKRVYKRWQRQEPMHLWQLDIVGGVPLSDGRSCKLVTGIDDHSRFVVLAAVVTAPTGRAVCEAFTAAMRRHGVPSEVLTDNGAQFTGRHNRPQPVEVLFERICRENGITQRRTKPRSPTTTGKIERFHKALREEFLDHVGPLGSIADAQQSVDDWVSAYNHQRPHQALDMATPGSLFRPNGPIRLDTGTPAAAESVESPVPEPSAVVDVIEPPPAPRPADGAAVEFEARVPPTGEFAIRSGRQMVSLRPSMAGRIVTVWADRRSVHISVDGHLVRTVQSRLLPEDLAHLAMRGARPAGPPPAQPALRRASGSMPDGVAQEVEIERVITNSGAVTIADRPHLIGRRGPAARSPCASTVT